MRRDLAQLTPEGLASLANMGLVKRAQREIAAGAGPAIAEGDDGTVTGTFADGVVARLPPGKTLRDSPCTCGAPGVCRHRVAVVLAYRDRQAAQAQAQPPADEPPWSPADVDDAALAATAGARVLGRARALAEGGVVVEVDEPRREARLPTCNVRFLVPRDLAYARCDCALGGGCEHVVVAVWAFRAARQSGLPTVSLGAARSRSASPEAWAEARALARDVLATGVAELGPGVVQRFTQVRAALANARLAWPLAIVEDLEQQVAAYHARSARYRARTVADLVTELEARSRAASGRGELPPAYVLGSDESAETALDHVRLVGLGARVVADGRARVADVYLADPDAGTVLVLRKRWDFGQHEAPLDGGALARRTVAARASLQALAAGQVVSKSVKRRASRAITIGMVRLGDTSVTPQVADWGALPPQILVRDFAAHLAQRSREPPRMLRPRVLAEHVRVAEVASVGDMVYVAADQALVAEVKDAAGAALRLVVRHHAAAPHAIDAVAAALRAGVRFAAGDLAAGAAGLEMTPSALACGGTVIVPDLAASATAWRAPTVARDAARSPLDEALGAAESVLEEAAQLGLASVRPDWGPRVAAARARLAAVGFTRVAEPLAALEAGRASGVDRAVGAWLEASLRVAMARVVTA